MTALWKTHAPLTAVSLLMVAALAACAVGLIVDPRVVAGASAWLKPAKFAASTATYGFTLAWLLGYLPDWTRTRRAAGWVTAVVFVIEVGTISLQAWRGTTSHFNVATPLDKAIFATMGVAILVQWCASIAVTIALWQQRFGDVALGSAVRLGMVVSIAGAAIGGLMTRPTSTQLASARASHQLAAVGAHTVGGPDGGPGLPGTTWSTRHGDLRVPHFVGLHAMQVLPVISLGLARRRRAIDERRRLVRVAAASYAALTLILLWQALRGQSLVSPDAATLTAFGVWAVATAAAAVRRFEPAAAPSALASLALE